MPPGHHHPVQDGKIYETTDHDKGIVTAGHLIIDTTHPEAIP